MLILWDVIYVFRSVVASATIWYEVKATFTLRFPVGLRFAPATSDVSVIDPVDQHSSPLDDTGKCKVGQSLMVKVARFWRARDESFSEINFILDLIFE